MRVAPGGVTGSAAREFAIDLSAHLRGIYHLHIRSGKSNRSHILIST
ncbi:MAG: hypothetical protein M3Y08_07390 [Fibrobacterota bacterium]|nr:hypothetical protein [Fibrobacterota bacterium]